MCLNLCECVRLCVIVCVADDTATSVLFSHFTSTAKSAASKTVSGVDMSGHNKMMKNFDK